MANDNESQRISSIQLAFSSLACLALSVQNEVTAAKNAAVVVPRALFSSVLIVAASEAVHAIIHASYRPRTKKYRLVQ